MLNRLKTRDIRTYRERLWHEQKGICPLCETYIEPTQAVLDHDHASGRLRQVLHRSCNALEGKLKNAALRVGVTHAQLQKFLLNVLEYSAKTRTEVHPTFRTPEEKLERQKRRASKRRKLKRLNKI